MNMLITGTLFFRFWDFTLNQHNHSFLLCDLWMQFFISLFLCITQIHLSFFPCMSDELTFHFVLFIYLFNLFTHHQLVSVYANFSSSWFGGCIDLCNRWKLKHTNIIRQEILLGQVCYYVPAAGLWDQPNKPLAKYLHCWQVFCFLFPLSSSMNPSLSWNFLNNTSARHQERH